MICAHCPLCVVKTRAPPSSDPENGLAMGLGQSFLLLLRIHSAWARVHGAWQIPAEALNDTYATPGGVGPLTAQLPPILWKDPLLPNMACCALAWPFHVALGAMCRMACLIRKPLFFFVQIPLGAPWLGLEQSEEATHEFLQPWRLCRRAPTDILQSPPRDFV